MNTPPFFNLLGIAPTQEQREIKRAYAVALKKIDQEHQPEAFAALREAYELAQKWCRKQEARNDPTSFEMSTKELSAPEPRNFAPTEQAEPSPQPRRSANRPDALTKERERWINRLCTPNLENAETLLHEALNDASMVSLDAISDLEKEVLNFLSRSEATNFALFDAMSKRFNWREYAKNLPESRSKMWLMEVLEQEAAWHLQGEMIFRFQMAALEAIKKNQNPSALEIDKYWKGLVKRIQNYPLYIRLFLSEKTLQIWNQAAIENKNKKKNQFKSSLEGMKNAGFSFLNFIKSLFIASFGIVFVIAFISFSIAFIKGFGDIPQYVYADKPEYKHFSGKLLNTSICEDNNFQIRSSDCLAFTVGREPSNIQNCEALQKFVDPAFWASLTQQAPQIVLKNTIEECAKKGYWTTKNQAQNFPWGME